MPTLTLSRAAVALSGVTPSDVRGPTLSPDAARALKPHLEQYGFDMRRPIGVREIPDHQGFAFWQ
jgi:hypothetical protein